jgi:type IV pilus assembly protein PilB
MQDNKEEGVLRILVEQGMLEQEQAGAILQQVSAGQKRLKEALRAVGIKEETLAKTLASWWGLPYVDLRDRQIAKEVLNVIPESTAREHLIIAYEETDEVLKVAMADPRDRQIVEFIHKKVDKPVEVGLTNEMAIRETMSQYQGSLESELQNLIVESSATLSKEGDLSAVAEDLPIIRITDAILKHAILQGASDIHIEPLEEQVIVRYRVDGILHDKLLLPKTVTAGLVARIKILSGLKIDEHRLPQDGRFKIETTDYKVSFRVSILPVFNGEKVVMRLLDESGQGLGLDNLGMRPKVLEGFRRAISRPHGMILVTGPTGSGKTTTLYAAMRELNSPEVNISTVEDPIEYQMARVNQTQVQPVIGLTFANGLRALVRQDPDIIMVGEIRDEETASLAINAALTGHLVLSTLHTNSAAGAVPRLVDMKAEPFLIASTTNIILAQRLVRRLCGKCRIAVPIDDALLDSLKFSFELEGLWAVLRREQVIKKEEDWKKLEVYQPGSCDICTGGYKGRLGIYEVLEMTPKIQELVTSNTTAQQLTEAAKEEQQMVTMLEDGFMKTLEGQTSIEEILRVAKE